MPEDGERFEVTQLATPGIDAIKDVVIVPLYEPKNETERYMWYQRNAGYFQVLIK